jgi:hypothetical protein
MTQYNDGDIPVLPKNAIMTADHYAAVTKAAQNHFARQSQGFSDRYGATAYATPQPIQNQVVLNIPQSSSNISKNSLFRVSGFTNHAYEIIAGSPVVGYPDRLYADVYRIGSTYPQDRYPSTSNDIYLTNPYGDITTGFGNDCCLSVLIAPGIIHKLRCFGPATGNAPSVSYESQCGLVLPGSNAISDRFLHKDGWGFRCLCPPFEEGTGNFYCYALREEPPVYEGYTTSTISPGGAQVSGLISGGTTGTVQIYQHWSSSYLSTPPSLYASGKIITVINRDPTLNVPNNTYVHIRRLNGEWRICWAAC